MPILFFLISCGRPPVENNMNQIFVWEQEDSQATPYMDRVFREFESLPENKDLEIVRTHYQTEDLRQQFQAASLAGVPPELIFSPSDTAGVYAISGFILPVNEYFETGDYNKAAIESISLDGKTWGIPVSNGNHLMLFYNKSIVKVSPKSTKELFEMCADPRIKAKTEYCMAFDMGEPFWLMPWLGAFGGWPLENKTPTLNTPALKNAINFYLDLKYSKKIVPKECDYNCMDSLFKEEKAAFIINGDWAISGYLNRFKDKLGIALLPRLSETNAYPTPMISGKYFMISSEIKKEKLEKVISLLKFYTNKKNQIAQFKELKRLPSLRDAANSKEIMEDPISRISMKQILKGRPMPMAVEMRAIWDLMRNYLGLAITKKMDVDIAAEKLQTNVTKKIDEMNR